MIGDGRQAQFARFVSSERRWLCREGYRLCGDWHEAEDLVQVSMIKVYLHWERLTEHERLAGYARRVMLTTYLSERRRSRFRYEVSHSDVPDRPVADTASDSRVTLMWAVAQLVPRQREIILLRFFKDLTVDQAAAVLRCPAGTVTSETSRALKALRRILQYSA
jgi:RNA polymerase sigma-70 factor (sigma-E family)